MYTIEWHQNEIRKNDRKKRERERENSIKKFHEILSVIVCAKHEKLPLNIEFWYIGSGCKRTCRVASMNAKVANIHASMQPAKTKTRGIQYWFFENVMKWEKKKIKHIQNSNCQSE